MCVDTRITCGTGQVLVFSVGNVEMRPRITVFLCETKVNDVDLVAPLTDTHQKVIRFDITMDKVLGVDVLDSGKLTIAISP